MPVGDSDHHGSGAITIRLFANVPVSVPTDDNNRTRRQQMMPLNYCYRWSQNRPRQVCPFAVPMVTTTTPPVPSPLEHVPASNRLFPPFDPEKKAKKQKAMPTRSCFSKTPFPSNVSPKHPIMHMLFLKSHHRPRAPLVSQCLARFLLDSPCFDPFAGVWLRGMSLCRWLLLLPPGFLPMQT